MFRVNAEQMRALRRVISDEFRDYLAVYLRATFPGPCRELHDEALKRFVSRGMSGAAEHGLDAEEDVRRYVECRVRFGEGFERRSATRWIAEILDNRTMSAEERMDRIERRSVEIAKR